jgi:hypothetical protein
MTRRAPWILSMVSFILAAALPLSAADAGVSGKWKMTSKSPRGERVTEISIAQSGEKLTVTSKDREGGDVTSEGRLKGADITWTVKRSTPMGEMVVVFTGRVDGKTMAGTASYGERGIGEWKAERIE